MNWAAWAPAIIAVAGGLIPAIFMYGRASQRQNDHADRLDGHEKRLDDQGKHLGRIDIALVRLEEYNRGLSDGAKLAARPKENTR